MIVIKVELHSAVTRQVTELARMYIANVSRPDTPRNGLHDYHVRTLRGRNASALDREAVQREAKVESYPAERIHVWHLVYAALKAMGYIWPTGD